MTKWIDKIFSKICEKLVGPEHEVKETIVLKTAKEFFEKLKENKVSFTIVKDPYKLAFAPYYMLWFDGENTTYEFYLSPESSIWNILKRDLEIYFPNEDGLWAQTVPYEEIKKFL